MILKHLMELYEILDDPKASGEKVKEYLLQVNPQADVETYPVHGEKGWMNKSLTGATLTHF